MEIQLLCLCNAIGAAEIKHLLRHQELFRVLRPGGTADYPNKSLSRDDLRRYSISSRSGVEVRFQRRGNPRICL
jgi:hypothetical protein